ncbi:HlyD family type I secretion periplasmic adaptor subunit [Nioella nitratireducens]|uniref:HlyD family type I secretion periplasmic adaptor subunit n=1 Tax=Nioella nitratireducens TaxID=1287720 RepID=UPI0008FD3814|nr:HlyD family type I secretion periplasmic adaptor subunit [Nioella nitratireducens]
MTRPLPQGFSRASAFAWLGVMVIFLTFAGFGAWAAFARIDAAIIAPGVVATVERGQRLQHLEGGIVAEVLVVEGDEVQEGDTLVRLDPLQQLSDRRALRDRVDSAGARIARLLAERGQHDRVDFPDGLPEAIRQREQALFVERRNVLLSNVEILDQREGQINEEIAGLQDQAAALRERLALQREMLDRMQDGSDRGIVETNRVVEQRDLVIQIRASLGQIASDIATARSDALSTQAELARARQQYSERAAAQLTDAQDALSTHESELDVIEDALTRTDMRAPISGRVQEVNVAPNDVIQAGQILMEITPQDQDFIVTARISPLDIENIRAGQRVEIRFRGYNSRRLDPAFGTVLTVSDNVVPASQNSDTPHYLARITVERDTLPREIRATVTFGMPVDVFLLQGERSVISYLVAPIANALSRSLREVD